MNAYDQGFTDVCMQLGVDPANLVKSAQSIALGGGPVSYPTMDESRALKPVVQGVGRLAAGTVLGGPGKGVAPLARAAAQYGNKAMTAMKPVVQGAGRVAMKAVDPLGLARKLRSRLGGQPAGAAAAGQSAATAGASVSTGAKPGMTTVVR